MDDLGELGFSCSKAQLKTQDKAKYDCGLVFELARIGFSNNQYKQDKLEIDWTIREKTIDL